MFERPLLILGAGVQSCREEAVAFVERTGVQVVLTWGAADLLPWNNPFRVGTFGTHGNKYANLAVQNADFVLCIGSRLDTKATGYPVSSFAPNAREFWMVDIDYAEIAKMEQLGRRVDQLNVPASRFFENDHPWIPAAPSDWHYQIAAWKEQFPAVPGPDAVPYVFVDGLSDKLRHDDVIVSDTGCALAWMMQAFRFSGQRFVHAFNQTPMGCGLGMAIGAAFATGRRVICVTGDGGLSLGRAELTTIAGHNLPIKIILFENRAHAMCMSTQRQWFGGEYVATSADSGLSFPDFNALAQADRIPQYTTVPGLLSDDHPGLLVVPIDPMHDVAGQIKYGESLA